MEYPHQSVQKREFISKGALISSVGPCFKERDLQN